MIALIYFMKLFDIEYFNKISQKCVGNKSVLQLLKNSSPLYLRVFLIEALEFIVLFCAGTFITNAYTYSHTYRERRK